MSGELEPGRDKRSQQATNLPDDPTVTIHPGSLTGRLRAELLKQHAEADAGRPGNG